MPYKPFTEGPTRPQFSRSRAFDVEHVRLDLRIDPPGRRLSGEAAIRVRPIHEVRSLEFDAVELKIRSVRALGRSLPFVCEDGKIRIELPAPRRDAAFEVRIAYDATPRRGMYFVPPKAPRRHWQVWTQGELEDNRHWFPGFDYPNDRATTECVITVPEPYRAVSNGALVSETRDRRRKERTFHWRQSVPHVNYLVCVVVGVFEEASERADGVPVQYLVPPGKRGLIRSSFGRTPAILRFFSERTGIPYPYEKYAQIALADFMWGGMENTTLTTINERSLMPERLRADADPDGLVAHEAAHQWWGDLITTKSWEHLWLNEGFATYFDPLFAEHLHGKEEFQYRMFENAESYFVEDAESYRRPVVTPLFEDPEDLFDRHAYPKGAWILHMIRGVLGEERFWKGIRHYAKKHRGGCVETADLRIAFEESTGESLEGLFRQWLFQAGYPEFEAKWSHDTKAGLLRFTVKQVQKLESDTPVFETPAEILVVTAKGRSVHRVRIERPEHDFFLPCAERPSFVQFDPDGWILKKLKFEKDPAESIRELKRSPGILGRIQAADALGARAGDPDATTALAKALRSDPFFGVRRSSAKALGRMATPAALRALAPGLRDRHPRVRRMSADALGNFQDDAAAAKAVAPLLRDPSEFVVATALRSLGRIRAPGAFARISAALSRDSYNDLVRQGAFDGLGELRDLRSIALAKAWTRPDRNAPVRAAAMGCLGRLWEFAQDRKPEIRECLVRLLSDPAHMIRRMAFGAVSVVADPAALSALEEALGRESVSVVRHAARLALRRSRERLAAAAKAADVKRDLDAVRTECRKLASRVQALESRLSAGKRRK
ncbi:MAG: M1 family aminopeptidase [Planctomycetota bacterium]